MQSECSLHLKTRVLVLLLFFPFCCPLYDGLEPAFMSCEMKVKCE